MAKNFIPFKISILTVSDTRTEDKDLSGRCLAELVEKSGHKLQEKCICPDNRYAIRSLVSKWIAESTEVILLTGGTGVFDDDVTPEAVQVLFDKEIPGFGELFRFHSYQEIGNATLQSRVLAGIANRTLIFVLPGSPNACKTGWGIIEDQIHAGQRCSFANVLTHEKKL